MKLICIEVENFFRFEHAKLDLEQPRGLVFIRGINKDSPSANSNGSGKSAMFVEALLWCWYGRTARKLASNHVVRRGSKGGTRVCVRWKHQGCVHTVARHQQYKKLGNALHYRVGNEDKTQSDKRRTQELIEEALGFNMDACRYALALGQNALNFTEATDAEKKLFFDRILQFDKLKDCRERAKARRDELTQELQKQSAALAVQEAALNTFKEQVAARQKQAADWVSAHDARVGTCKQMLQTLQSQRNTFPTRGELESKLDTTKLQIEQTEVASRERFTLDNLIRRLKSELAHLQNTTDMTRDMLSSRKNEISKTPETICSTCGQPLPLCDLASVRQKIEESRKQLAVYEEQVISGEASIAQKSQECLNAEQQLATLPTADDNALQALKRELQKLQSVKVEIATADAKVFNQQERLQELEAEVNPFEQAIKDAYLQVDQCVIQIKKLKDETEVIKQDIEYAEFWLTGFGPKGLQSYILDTILPFLSQRANYYSNILTGGQIAIQFNSQRVTAEGNLKEDFTVVAQNSEGCEVYEGNSEGEKERINLSVALALQDLVLSRVGTDLNIAVFDECCKHVDAEGNERVMALLNDLVKRRSTIFFISHDPRFEDFFHNTLIIKREKGVAELQTV